MLIRILTITLVPYYPANVLTAAKEVFTRAETEEWTDRNRLFAVFVQKTCSIFDLKARLEDELGLPFDQT